MRRKLEGQICADTVLCHIAQVCQQWQDQKNLHPACTSSWPDGPASSPHTSARSRCEREQASPGNLEDVWPSHAVLDRPSTPIPPLQPPLQTDSPGLCSSVPHLWTHGLAFGAHSTPASVEHTATSSTITILLVLCFSPQTFPEEPVVVNYFQQCGSSYWRGFVQSLKKNHRYKQLIRDTH